MVGTALFEENEYGFSSVNINLILRSPIPVNGLEHKTVSRVINVVVYYSIAGKQPNRGSYLERYVINTAID